eukprot:5981035-Lingulodinium_polyedra.AAC.1
MRVIPPCNTSGGVRWTHTCVLGFRIRERLSGGRPPAPRPLPPLPSPLGKRSLAAGERERRSDDAASS